MSNIDDVGDDDDDDDDYNGEWKWLTKSHQSFRSINSKSISLVERGKRKPIENLKEILREEVIDKTIPEKLHFVKRHTKSLQEGAGIVQMMS